ncbi:hypothetical protein M885DRAFT_618098 [Pelagophyceae sp. CCMP2097]|nr:hypothetical protein M885DRAFT_618098 [Pelagophyceae sp. CCMP2097]
MSAARGALARGLAASTRAALRRPVAGRQLLARHLATPAEPAPPAGAAAPAAAKAPKGNAGKVVYPFAPPEDEDEMEDMFIDTPMGREHGGPTRGGRHKEPTRFGDWERKGRCSDF